MTIYFICVFFILLTSIIRDHKVQVVMICTLLLLVFSLRSMYVGVDIEGYIAKFQIIAETDWRYLYSENEIFSNYEVGFRTYDKLVSYITTNPQIYLFISGLIIYIPVLLLFKEQCPRYIHIASVIYMSLPVYFVCLSGLRQAIAVSISIRAYLLIKHERPYTALFVIILAFLFHSSAFIALLFFVGNKVIISKKHFPLFCLIGVIIFLSRYTIAQTVISFLMRYDAYEIKSTGAISSFLAYLAVVIFAFTMGNDKDIGMIKVRNMVVIATLLQISASVSTNAGRLTYYFLPFIPILFTQIVDQSRKLRDSNRIVLCSLCAIVFTIAMFTTFISDANGALSLAPYSFFWN